jgi:formylglycine-generating enzyme required for sulfatase activity
MRSIRTAGSLLLAALSSGCLRQNPHYAGRDMAPQPAMDLAPAGDMRVEVPDLPFLLIEGGMFRHRALPDGGGGDAIELASYYLEVTEVTVEAYGRCMASGSCTPPPDQGSACNPPAKRDHPINCVTWDQAAQFCTWTGRRLPSDAEWEHAVRGQRYSLYPWGNLSPDTQAPLCWKRGTQGTCPAGTSARTLLGAPDPGGVSDLAGNVYEWTADRHVRGGSWASPIPEPLTGLFRFKPEAGAITHSPEYGFRCAMSR